MQCTTRKGPELQEVDIGGLEHGGELHGIVSSGLDVKPFTLLFCLIRQSADG